MSKFTDTVKKELYEMIRRRCSSSSRCIVALIRALMAKGSDTIDEHRHRLRLRR
jgi:hypothetical protein